MENFSKGFLMLPNSLANMLPLLGLTQREFQIVFLIIRLTYGCRQIWAKLKQADFSVIGISPTHIKVVLEPLIEEKVILKNGRLKQYRLNKEYLISKRTGELTDEIEGIRTLVIKQLSSRNGNQDLTSLVTNDLPEEELLTYQNSNKLVLPNGKLLASEDQLFVIPKDRLNTSKNSDKQVGISIKKESQLKFVDPTKFNPDSSAQNAALETWQTLESDKPNSFSFYLWAAKKGLPVQKFYEFASEIKQDRTILNKGAIFVHKVMIYLQERR